MNKAHAQGVAGGMEGRAIVEVELFRHAVDRHDPAETEAQGGEASAR